MLEEGGRNQMVDLFRGIIFVPFYLLRSKIVPGFENPQRAKVVIATAREDKAA